jgi:hypothetical protein
MNSTTRKRREGRKHHMKPPCLDAQKNSIFLLINSISSLSTLSTNIYKDFLILVVFFFFDKFLILVVLRLLV